MNKTMKPNQYTLDESLGYLTGKFCRLLLKRNVEKFAQFGLAITSEQWIALAHLWTEDGITQQTLSGQMYKDKGSMTRLINSLEAKGLLNRLPSPNDGREKFVYLTDKGREVMKQATELVHNVLDSSYTGIDEDELNICKSVLRRAFKNIE